MQKLEKILEEMKESSIMVATSKEHYIHPQDGRFVEEVVLLNDVEEIIRKHLSRENGQEIMGIKIRDNETGEIFEYGTNIHHALRISKNGGCLTFENLQNGDGSLKSGDGGYSFVLNDGKTPEESSSPDSMYGATYANIGGFHEHLSRENTPEITRSPRDNDVTEYCPHCDREITVLWDVEQDGYQIFCPNCGKTIMLCSMCDREPCDWTENGCKYSDERYRDYFRKHMNDGWIPVEERLPGKNEYFVDTSSNKEFPNGYYRRLEIAYMTDTVEYIHGYYDGYKWMDEYLDAIKNVVAWRIHEPYRPERSSDEKE